jgi:hypothetical protein
MSAVGDVISDRISRVLREVGRKIAVRQRVKIKVVPRTVLDRLPNLLALVFCRHREHKNRVRQVLARYILQLSHAGVNFFSSTLVPLESLLRLPCLLLTQYFLSPLFSEHSHALRAAI